MYPNSNWGYKTGPQTHLDDRVIDYSRGKGLGGTSNINFACYTVGPRDDYDHWAERVGDSAFNWENAVKSRESIEHYLLKPGDQYAKYYNPVEAVHSTNGSLHVGVPQIWEEGITEVLDAAEEAGLGIDQDVNSGEGFGLGVVPATMTKNYRATAATAFLSDVPSNLTIVTDSQATKILFDGMKAVGLTAGGKEYRASKEVILSCGAIDTPKLLMLSGVGDKQELSKHGIDCVLHLPGVGNNLQDHLFFSMVWRQHDEFSANRRAGFLSREPAAVEAAKKEFQEHGTGPLAVYFNSLAMGFFRNDDLLDDTAISSVPKDLQEHMNRSTVPMFEIVAYAPNMNPTANLAHSYLTFLGVLMNPASRGSIKLSSSDPADPPLADPNFLAHPFDRANAIATAKKLMQFVETPSLKKTILEPFNAPTSLSDEDLLAHVKANGVATWHPSCTVAMGKEGEEGACVDSDFRLYGAEKLRVVDLSVLPFLINAHPQSVAYLIGQIAAQKVIKEYGLD